MQEIQFRKDELSTSRQINAELTPCREGELIVKIDHYSLTANNVTYGVVGEKIGYWQFFPPHGEESEGWGIIPVWGFAEVMESQHPDVSVGEVLYGYFPMATHLKMKPSKVADNRLLDGSEHRQNLPPVYNSYARVKSDPNYDASSNEARSLLFPLYATSYCLYDFLVDNSWFMAEQIIIVSASSKTSLGLAYALDEDDKSPKVVGITSSGNKSFVDAQDVYDSTLTFDQLASVEHIPSVIIDMSGSGSVLAKLHKHLANNMLYCSNVGLTHWDANAMQDGFIKERSHMFFAPGHIQKRSKDWGPGVFDSKALEFWKRATFRSQAWLKMQHISGLTDAEATFHALRQGKIDPKTGLIVRP